MIAMTKKQFETASELFHTEMCGKGFEYKSFVEYNGKEVTGFGVIDLNSEDDNFEKSWVTLEKGYLNVKDMKGAHALSLLKALMS